MNVDEFLRCSTPDSWLQMAKNNQDVLLVDHANCEKKAASTALNLMYRYEQRTELMMKLSKLAREELRHFEQVLAIMKKRDINYVQISSARYAAELRKGVRTFEPARLIDILIVSAIIEARSCERFSALVEVLDGELVDFYGSLLQSEQRHFTLYLGFAEDFAKESAKSSTKESAKEPAQINIDDRIEYFLEQDKALITEPDALFRFHSGAPIST